MKVLRGFGQRSVRVQSGFGDGAAKVTSMFNQVQSGLGESNVQTDGSVSVQSGFRQDSTRVQ